VTTTKDRTEYIIDGVTITMVPRESYDMRSYGSKSRVYGAIDALTPELEAIEPQWVSEPVGQEVDDLTKVKGKIWRAWRDGTKKIAGERLSALIAKLNQTDLPIKIDTTVTFSYKAGCSCGCSPGFILSGRLRDVNHRPVDLYLHIEKEENDA